MKSKLTLRLLGASLAVAASFFSTSGANAAGAKPIGEYCVDGICLGEPATAYVDFMWPESEKEILAKYPACGGRTSFSVSSAFSKFRTKSGYEGAVVFSAIPGSDKDHYFQITEIRVFLPNTLTKPQVQETFESVARRYDLKSDTPTFAAWTHAHGVAKNGWKVSLWTGPFTLYANTGITADTFKSQPGCGAATPKL